jgi:hypothetical protein
MKVRTLSARRHENLTGISIIEPQTKAVTTVWLTPAELAKAVSGLLAVQRSLEAEQREAA